MYHVTGTIAIATIIYLISFYFYRAGFFSIQFHRKLWNIILATAFLTTALAGIFLALQVNNKWELSITDIILKWHVEFGIGLAITGLFHFIWHFSYYTGRKTLPKGERVEGTFPPMEKTKGGFITSTLFVIGFVSSSVQILLLREIMNIAGGYELISGVFLGSWLITSAAGSAVAGRSSMTDIRKIIFSFAFSPIVSLFLLLFLSRIFTITGQTPTFLESFIYTIIVTGPFCFVSGFSFVKILGAGRKNSLIPAGSSFAIETAGGVLAGVIISVMTAGIFNTYELLCLIILLAISFAVLNFSNIGKTARLFVKSAIAILAILLLGLNTDNFFRQILLPGIQITKTKDTPYGNLTTGVYKGDSSIFYNERILKYSEDVTEREEDVHYGMLQSDDPQNVLIVSGSLSSHLPEIRKYAVKKITYVERDPALIDSEKSITGNSTAEIDISVDDAYRFLRETNEIFDVILLLVPPPSTLLLNRYYTTEFFISSRQKLIPGGILLCSPGIGENYYNKESIRVISSVYNSLKKVFRNVVPVSGNKLYFIASDKELSTAICSLSVKKGIQNLYVGPDYLSDDLILAKSSEIIGIIDPNIKENSLSFPIACMAFQSLIFNMKASEKIPSVLLLTLIFAIPVLVIRRKNLIMYTAACSMAGFEIILLLAIQLSVGNVYQITGLILASVMSGLATGAMLNFSVPGKFKTKSIVLILVVLYLLAAPFLNLLQNLNNHFLVISLLLIIGFVPGIITGNLFRELTKGKDSSVSAVYSADLAGSASGFIIISAVAVPVLGITMSVIFLSFINFAGFLFGTAPSNE